VSDLQKATNSERSNDQPAHLEGLALQCARGGQTLFRDFDFSLQAGTLLQIIGANGSGKTTLLKVLTGLMEASAGEVHWKGKNIRAALPEYHRELCYIGHSLGFKLELNSFENLAFTKVLNESDHSLTIEQALSHVGLAAVAGRTAKYLSAGQKRRLALARLLITPATLWLLDEPFSALDDGGRQMVEKMLAEHIAGGGMAVVTTHQEMNVRPVQTCRLEIANPADLADPVDLVDPVSERTRHV